MHVGIFHILFKLMNLDFSDAICDSNDHTGLVQHHVKIAFFFFIYTIEKVQDFKPIFWVQKFHSGGAIFHTGPRVTQKRVPSFGLP